MKHSIIYLTAVCLLIFGATQLNAQSFNKRKNNYLILSKNIQQLKPVLMTAEKLLEEDGKKYGVFHMIICGKTVVDIANNPSFNALLKDAETQGVKVFACGISLQKFNINTADLPKGLTVVDNGILYGFQLKKKGFITLTI
ncbi:DsrE family protein [Mariniflexile sp. AS56]|uniref:DsrE family protein n=1 Tax=Mariniflexile sp. AS56 TaxID=3063957 RepID=UPI0026EEDD4D|nr:DsrE family protein [Mariniflexile sp. AS56]MDO7174214.1 DsrE family protein [Mariniflexile sp. AS56]